MASDMACECNILKNVVDFLEQKCGEIRCLAIAYKSELIESLDIHKWACNLTLAEMSLEHNIESRN